MVFPKFGHHNDKKSSSSPSLDHVAAEAESCRPIELFIDIESPPCVLYGAATESTGSLLSGLLTLRVKSPIDPSLSSDSLTATTSASGKKNALAGLNTSLSQTFSHLSLSNHAISPVTSAVNLKTHGQTYSKISVKTVTLSLIQKTRYKKPFQPSIPAAQSCMNCQLKTTELARWDIVTKETDIPIGDHAYPFSYLIPGSIPASVHLGSSAQTQITYELVAVSSYKPAEKTAAKLNGSKLLQLRLPVTITRSILRGPDRNSLRVFPPTDLTASCVLPNVIYPKSTFPLELKVDGVSSEDRRWRMRRLNWRIEEKARVRLSACEMHKSKLKQLEKETKKAESQKGKNKTKPVKRSQDAGPLVTTSVSTIDDVIQLTNPVDDPENQNQEETITEDNPDNPDSFIHPSDDAMRQAITAEQQRLRQQRLQEEVEHESALFTEEVRTIASGNVKSGWKSDFGGRGKIELVTDINCMGLNSGVTNPINRASSLRPFHDLNKQPITVACDIEDPHLGIYVQHLLILEIIVAEEALQYANGQPIHRRSSTNLSSQLSATSSNGNTDQRLAELSPMFAARNPTPQSVAVDAISQNQSGLAPVNSRGSSNGSTRIVGVPTGAARVLRMQYRIAITERSGLGISWDDEVPPTYQDVRLLSPPSYDVATSASGTPLMQPSLELDSTVHLDSELRQELGRNLASNSSSDLYLPARPPQAHSHENSFHGLSALQSPQLESIVSIQGNTGSEHLLTPQNTHEIRLPNVSELMDTDRITQ
ncbi:LAFE_0D11078g1_1 [Lachancea fermentati]|uniref:LAFE_0D11078g1_1 n=1 Tax=Lachancea fermentati TaxID=4955 RepID=A0A1G4MBZ7_LACFM|nr:LAFE_0D11078g1_1 [Lachancea fermentati]